MSNEALSGSDADGESPAPGGQSNESTHDHPSPSSRRSRLGLYRSLNDRYVAGVCGGLGERFDIDPTILRIVVAVAAVAFAFWDAAGVVPVFYAIAWLVIPNRGQRSLLATFTAPESLRTIAGVAVLTIVTSLLLANPAMSAVVALLGAAWVLLNPGAPSVRGDRTDDDDDAPTTETADPSTVVASTFPDADTSTIPEGESRSARWGRARRGRTAPLPSLGLQRRSTPRREPALWPLTVALLVAWTVLFVVIDQNLPPGVSPVWFMSGALIIIGGVLVLSAWRGRAGWTVIFAVALIPLWLAYSVIGIGRYAGEGTRWVDVDEPPVDGYSDVELGYGELTVDVGPDALAGDEPLELDAFMTAGTMTIRVPQSTRVELRGAAGFVSLQDIEVFGDPYEGYWQDGHYERSLFYDRDVRRTLNPLPIECVPDSVTADQLDQMYSTRQEIGTSMGRLSSGAEFDFDDPRLFEELGSTEPLEGHEPIGGIEPLEPHEPSEDARIEHLQSFFYDGFGQLPTAIGENAGGATIWLFSRDQYGRECQPDAQPVEGKTLVVYTRMGLGEIRVERY